MVWSGDRLSFEALQRRASSGSRTVQQLAAAMPAHFIAFDVLQKDGQELVNERYERRRTVLEDLFIEHGLTPPWTLCPMTTDPAVAQEWLDSWTEVQGVEGLVINSLLHQRVEADQEGCMEGELAGLLGSAGRGAGRVITGVGRRLGSTAGA